MGYFTNYNRSSSQIYIFKYVGRTCTTAVQYALTAQGAKYMLKLPRMIANVIFSPDMCLRWHKMRKITVSTKKRPTRKALAKQYNVKEYYLETIKQSVNNCSLVSFSLHIALHETCYTLYRIKPTETFP